MFVLSNEFSSLGLTIKERGGLILPKTLGRMYVLRLLLVSSNFLGFSSAFSTGNFSAVFRKVAKTPTAVRLPL